jgi:hypothetical protein
MAVIASAEAEALSRSEGEAISLSLSWHNKEIALLRSLRQAQSLP